MQKELIDKDKVLDILYDMQHCGFGEKLCLGAFEEIQKMPNKATPISKWIVNDHIIYCHYCNGRAVANQKTKFCPNCGAKMGVTE